MSLSYEAPQQYGQSSRKGKKAWRKHVDVSDVQAGLEQVRAEEIKGGVISEKPSDALFTIDAVGAPEIRKAYHKIYKPLKADEILARRSAIPAVDTRKRTTDGILEKPSKRRKTNGVSREKLDKLRTRAFGGEKVPKNVVDTDGVPRHDPWEEVAESRDPRFSFLDQQKPITVPRTLSEAPISLLQSQKAIPGVTTPKPGISYNPTFQDWDELLVEEGQKEVEAERKRIREAKEVAEQLARIEAAHNERDNIPTEDESAWEGFDSEVEGADWLGKKKPERKSQADRNRIKRRKEAERQAKHLASVSRKKQQAEHIRAIADELHAHDQSTALAVQKDPNSSDEELDDRRLRRRKLGRAHIPERSLELLLPEELQDSLRLLKPQGNLLQDRFRNILVRGRVETRKAIQQPKRFRKTYTEKWTYKDFTVST